MTTQLYCTKLRNSIRRYQTIPPLQAILAFLGLEDNDSEQLFQELSPAISMLCDAYGIQTPVFQFDSESLNTRGILTNRPILGFVMTVQNTKSFKIYYHEILTLLHLVNAEFPDNENGKLARYALAGRRFFELYDSYCQQNKEPHIPLNCLKSVADDLISFQPQDIHNINNFVSLMEGGWRETKNITDRNVSAKEFKPVVQKINIDGQKVEYASSTPKPADDELSDSFLEDYLKTFFREVDATSPAYMNRWKQSYQKAAIAQHQQISPFARDVAQVSELRVLYNAFHEFNDGRSKQILGFLILSANTGLSLETLVEAIPRRAKKIEFPIRFQEGYSKYTYPLFALGYDNKIPDQDIYHKSGRLVTIYLPVGLSKFIRELELDRLQQINYSRIKQETSKLISQINKQSSTGLSLAKIRNSFLAHYVARWELGEMHAAIIANKQTHRTATQMNYTRFFPSQLHASYTHAFNKANEHYNFFEEHLEPVSIARDIPFGSKVVPKDQAIGSVFSFLRKKISELDGSTNFISRKKHYNYAALYTYLFLQLLTGHRPVATDTACETIFIPADKMIIISDKDNQSFSENRSVPLHDKYWQLYSRFKHIQDNLLSEHGLLSNTYSSSKQCHLLTDSLFILDEGNQRRWFSTGVIQEVLENKSILPNFLRHWLRTWLQNNNYSKTLIDHTLGHFTVGTETLNILSTLDTNRLYGDILSYQEVLLHEFMIGVYNEF
jgi:hypothetical protein